MLPDDFFGGIALDRLRTGVPVGDDPVQIEHVDCVIAYALNQHAKALLALEKSLLRLLRVGNIPRYLGECDELAVFRQNGVDHDARPETAAILATPPAFALELALFGGGAKRHFGQP